MRIKDQSQFIFIAISSKQNETSTDKERFIKDVYHSIYVLQQIGVQGSNITVVSDWDSQDWATPGFGPIKPTLPNDVCKIIQTVDIENLFIITSCHGGINGIGGPFCIKPNELIESIKANVNIKNCLVFFGQCYAGVFNYTNVSDNDKNIVYIGATGMRSGISSTITWDIPNNTPITWIANIAVFYMFEWFEKPVDVDNDGNYSIMDLYKYVSYYTNNKTEQIEKKKVLSFLQSQIIIEIQKLINQKKPNLLTQLDAQAQQVMMDYFVPHQDCWILNAIPASSMNLEFD